MNKKIGTVAAKVNIIAVAGFALSMLLRSNFLSYITSIFIALSFVPMMCALCFLAGQEKKRRVSSEEASTIDPPCSLHRL